MRVTRRVVAIAFAGAGAVVLGGATSAWAWCSPFIPAADGVPGSALTVSPADTRAGETVTVSGSNWDMQHNPSVAIHWETATGSLLGRADIKDGSFSVAVTIPADSPGTHSIVAVFTPDYVAPLSFTIQAPEATATAAGQSGSSVAAASGGTATTPRTSSAAQPAPAVGASAPGVDVVTGSFPVRPDVTPRSTGAAAAPSIGHVLLSSSGTAPTGIRATAVGTPAAAAAAGSQGGNRLVSGDLWSGLAQGVPAPNTVGLQSSSTAANSNGAGVMVALLGAGVVALGAGFGVAELRRRRVPVKVTAR